MDEQRNNRGKPIVYPSLICADLCNLERDVKVLSDIGYTGLHVDIVDGYFSPSMPIGLDVIRQLREKTPLPFYTHLMAKEQDFFLEELIDIGIEQLCIHVETTPHLDHYLNRIKNNGVRAGLALNPGTPLSVLEYVVEKCDFILLMLINPGYAHLKNETQVPYALTKITNLRRLLDERGLDIPIELDGRISLDHIAKYHEAGADIFIGGTTCLFKNGDLVTGKAEIDRIIEEMDGKEGQRGIK